MKKIIVWLLPLFVLTGCGNSVTKNEREKIDQAVSAFFKESAYTDAMVRITEYRKAGIAMSDMEEYKIAYAEREKAIVHLCELLKDNAIYGNHHHGHEHDAPGHNCEDHIHANDLEKYGYQVEALGNRMKRIENAYTENNYRIKALLNERSEDESTPFVFYVNDCFEIISVEVANEKPEH